jgi:hypothetical protein
MAPLALAQWRKGELGLPLYMPSQDNKVKNLVGHQVNGANSAVEVSVDAGLGYNSEL